MRNEQEEIEAALRDVDAALRRADRALALERIHDEIEALQGLLGRRQEKEDDEAGQLLGASGQVLGIAGRLVDTGYQREALSAVLAVLRALLGDEPAAARLERLGRVVREEPSKRPPPYLEAFVASLVPLLDHLTHRQLWDRLASPDAEPLEYMGERLAWSQSHPQTGRPSRDGYLCHAGSGRVIGFRTFCGWLEKFARPSAGH